MKKDVMITIEGLQAYEDTDRDAIRLVTEGILSDDGGVLELTYEETALTGMEGTFTSFLLQGEQISLIRSGEVSSQMVFELGRRHHSLYATPFGNLEVVIFTSALRSTLTMEGGELEIHYSIELDHALAGENTFFVSVRPRDAAPLR